MANFQVMNIYDRKFCERCTREVSLTDNTKDEGNVQLMSHIINYKMSAIGLLNI